MSDHSPQHPDPNVAYHIAWEFRHEALLWAGNTPTGVNLFAAATQMRRWLLRGGNLAFFSDGDRKAPNAYTNLYTYTASTISVLYARALNATHTFASRTDPIDAASAEIERIALCNELSLYTARFCEVTIKQLLFCTQITPSYYKKTSLGGLLSVECRACKGTGKPRHKISMLGSLAHHYGQCLPVEKCLAEHLKIVNRRRNVEAAHSETQMLRIRTCDESRAELMKDSQDMGNEMAHMLQHVSDLELEMIAELRYKARL